MQVKLPYKFIPRPYQKEFFEDVMDYSTWKPVIKKKRWVMVWHRRSWKDKSIFNMLVIPEMINKVWLYYYIFPEQAQARKAFWENIDNDWFKLLNHIPKELIENINNSEMKLELKNGSILRVIGTDKNPDWIIWSNPCWIVFSERPVGNPIVWDYVRPMLTANWWWAYFVYTPRWHNHWYDTMHIAKKLPDTRALSMKTAKETLDNNWNRVLTDEQLQEEIDSGMDLDLFEQEYMISFEWAMRWAVYSEQVKLAETENRIISLPIETAIPIWTVWDLWISDTTAIWFVQFYWKEIRIIDHYEMSGKGLEHFVAFLNSKGYIYQWHYLPHDSEVRELWTGTTRKETLENLGLKNIKVTPKLKVDEWIDATRRLFKYMWFDKDRCLRWIDAIKSYVYEYDDKNKIRSKTPKHDWASHSADALRYLAVAYNDMNKTVSRPQPIVIVNQSERFL